MPEKQRKSDAALAELRRWLGDGLAASGLDKTQLARRSGLGRTTVSEAFQPEGPVPSAKTLAGLAKALGMPVEELLELRRTAAMGVAEPAIEEELGPGRPIEQWEPHDLEVHPAGMAPDRGKLSRQRLLPGYVPREHDRVLAEAVRHAQAGRSRMMVLSGTSSTGKTRACWEAVRPLANAGWKLWHPFDPTRAESALSQLAFVRPRTVVWLNEAQHYIGDAHVGEQIAAALHALLTDEQRSPVLVLGTLWPEYVRQYTILPVAGQSDPTSRARELLAGRIVSLPESFDAEALAAATQLARGGDQMLADALTRSGTHGRVTQDLAGAPELLHCYENGSPEAQALLRAAMDARRLGVGLNLPQAFLTSAALGYLTDIDCDDLTDDWAEAAYAELAKRVHGKQAPLRRVIVCPPGTPHPFTLHGSVSGPVFRLADYLEQHGRETRRRVCPPASFWHSVHAGLTNPDDLFSLAREAYARHRLQWAHDLQRRAVEAGHPDAYLALVTWLKESGNFSEAESVLRRAAEAGNMQALMYLASWLRNSGNSREAESVLRQAAETGGPNVLKLRVDLRREAGDYEGAEALAREAVGTGNPRAWRILAELLREVGDREEAKTLAREAADAGNPQALTLLADWCRGAGDREGAEALAREAVDAGNSQAWEILAELSRESGSCEGVETLARKAADAGNSRALVILGFQCEEAGEYERAEVLARQAADVGDAKFLTDLVFRREESGYCERAETLARQAAAVGSWNALTILAIRREESGDCEGAESLAREAAVGNPNALTWLGLQVTQRKEGKERSDALIQQGADAGDRYALAFLVDLRQEMGDHERAEALAWQAADAGYADPLQRVVSFRERRGSHVKAQALARQVADAGLARHLDKRWLAAQWPHGLDPEGTPTSPQL
ncbi:helix-turn-helix domain-containing protein [Streptomyces daliensis]|uniref:Helix-turn-helix domain-containing protein n=1 Tax=Streptomyces daliensis TaxID=299421 RepID=A0A8T4IRG9_9ACTN|nr:helix-turn-helix domain-containing protein [Streptomyces daliensis]